MNVWQWMSDWSVSLRALLPVVENTPARVHEVPIKVEMPVYNSVTIAGTAGQVGVLHCTHRVQF